MIIHITHNDTDALGCDFALRFAGKKKEPSSTVITFFCHHGMIDEKIKEIVDEYGGRGHTLYMTDILPSEESCKLLEGAFGTKLAMDHHADKMHYADKFDWIMVMPYDQLGRTTSAAAIFNSFLRSTFIGEQVLDPNNETEKWVLDRLPILDNLIHHVTLQDTFTWINKDGEIENIKAYALAKLVDKYGVEDVRGMLMYLTGKGIDLLAMDTTQVSPDTIVNNYFIRFEDALNEAREEVYAAKQDADKTKVDRLMIQGETYCVGYLEAYSASLPSFMAMVFNPNIDFTVCLASKDNTYGLRTMSEDIDLGKICNMFGGGGHKKAAGCQRTEESDRFFEHLRNL